MSIRAHVMSSGQSPQSAGSIVGGWVTQAVSGSSATDATLMAISSNFKIATSSSNQGCIFAPGNGSDDGYNSGDHGFIANTTGNTIKVYPPTGGTINGGTVTTGSVSLTTKQNAVWSCIDPLTFIVIIV